VASQVTTSEASGSEVRGRMPPDAAAAGLEQLSGPDFSVTFLRLQSAIGQACGRHRDWEAKIVAGIHAAFGFAAGEPTAARILTGGDGEAGKRADEVVAYFVDLIDEVAPSRQRHAISTDEAIVESIAILVRSHLRAGTIDELLALAPEVVSLTLLPYTGLAGARSWAEAASPSEL
jgi:hypothetical protein